MPDFYGPYVINTFSEKFYLDALKGKPLTWFGDLDVPIELIFIEDGGSAMVEAGLSEKTDGEEFNMPGYSPITAREFLEEISVQGGKDSKIKSINSEFIVGLGGLFNPLAREFKEMMYLKTTELILDGTKYKETFGPLPATPYKEGINKAFEWVKDFYGL